MRAIAINMEPLKEIKCHKCRHVLLYGFDYSVNNCPQKCNSYNVHNFIFLDDNKIPEWIKFKIEEENWTKGKLHCYNCGFKVGSFDFVSGRKCECGSTVLPSVHFITSQVDKPVELCLFNKVTEK
ncbi:unnamed protein product [Diatraea saccharalis]|uniref:Uncharacterized protein n=1 Tax=Diatraea saccharalis TaxID=40085 RepID=A0A9N9W4L7_9NEOP|nr:unnamed protein product [Diatraea saccharalis]